ncbi:hypothetical protein ACPPVU_13515 [Mucilaginibacter sp. McL0603]|uniref:hypothetical protein n=1 Tax=Mucilaginibacter sp. McL0603 TaxID=3415670 RepID=UPI003CFA299B
MRINRKVKPILLLLVTVSSAATSVWAQSTYKFKADLQKIDSSGVYKINLKPDQIAKCNEKLSDIRLLDGNRKFKAYVLSKNLFIDNTDQFIEFPEVNLNDNADSIYIAENKNGISTNNLSLKLKNTDVERSVNLSGSQDLKKWYAIKEDIPLEKAGTGNESEYQQTLYFPTSNYQYLKIQVNGKNKTPVKIMRAGVYLSQLSREEFAFLPPAKFNVKDTNKVSHVYIHFDEPYTINQLRLIVSAPNYYERHISIYDVQNKNANLVRDATISFRGKVIYLSAKTKQLRIDISNGDDVPLTVQRIDAFQQNQYLISYLEAGHSYSILSGDSSANEPVYDLSFLKSKPYNRVPVINHLTVYKNPAYVIQRSVVKKNLTSLLWVAIVAVLILLSFLTWKMVKEINARQVK